MAGGNPHLRIPAEARPCAHAVVSQVTIGGGLRGLPLGQLEEVAIMGVHHKARSYWASCSPQQEWAVLTLALKILLSSL